MLLLYVTIISVFLMSLLVLSCCCLCCKFHLYILLRVFILKKGPETVNTSNNVMSFHGVLVLAEALHGQNEVLKLVEMSDV